MNFNKQIDENIDSIISATKELISIKSVQGEAEDGMPFGKGVAQALDFVLNLADEMGFVTKNIDGYCGYAEYGEGDNYIAVLGHIDVPNEEGVEWRFDPYDATVANNRIHGCFAVDKGAIIAGLFALKLVKESKRKLNRKVRIFFGADGTSQYKDIEVYLKHENIPIAGFATDGHFPVTYAEKGLGVFEYEKDLFAHSDEYIEYMYGGKAAPPLVPGRCTAKLVTNRRKEILEKIADYVKENRRDINAKILNDGLLIEALGKERHSASIEMGINSIAILMDFLKYINFGDGDQKQVIKFICEKIGFDIYGENMGIASEDGFSGKTTVNLGAVEIIDSRIKITLDCRYAVTSNYHQAVETTNKLFTDEGFTVTKCDYWPPTYFPEDHFLVESLLQAYRDIVNDDSDPVSSSSASYSKLIPNTVAFGPHFPGEEMVWGQTDEYFEIDALKKTTQIYANAIYKLCMEV